MKVILLKLAISVFIWMITLYGFLNPTDFYFLEILHFRITWLFPVIIR
jgi:hypothetical protein